jgi:hypothetical protein
MRNKYSRSVLVVFSPNAKPQTVDKNVSRTTRRFPCSICFLRLTYVTAGADECGSQHYHDHERGDKREFNHGLVHLVVVLSLEQRRGHV